MLAATVSIVAVVIRAGALMTAPDLAFGRTLNTSDLEVPGAIVPRAHTSPPPAPAPVPAPAPAPAPGPAAAGLHAALPRTSLIGDATVRDPMRPPHARDTTPAAASFPFSLRACSGRLDSLRPAPVRAGPVHAPAACVEMAALSRSTTTLAGTVPRLVTVTLYETGAPGRTRAGPVLVTATSVIWATFAFGKVTTARLPLGE